MNKFDPPPRPPTAILPFDAQTKQFFWSKRRTPQWSTHSESHELASDYKTGRKLLLVGWVDTESDQPMYDQILLIGKGEVVLVPVNEQGLLGLVWCWRPVVRDQKSWRKSYLQEDPTTQLGRWSLEFPRELPRGFEHLLEDDTPRTEEVESQLVKSCRFLCWTNDNSARCCQMTAMVISRISSNLNGTEQDPNHAFVKRLIWASTDKFFSLVEEGKIFCGLTMAAMTALLGHQKQIITAK